MRGANSSRAQSYQKFTQTFAGSSHGLVMPLLVDPRANELEIEGATKSGFQNPADDPFKRYRTITRDCATRERAVTEYIVADLDQMAALHGALNRLSQPRFGPRREYVYTDADIGLFRQLHSVPQGMGEVNVGVKCGRRLDEKFDASLTRFFATGAMAEQNFSAASSQV